MTTVAIRNFRVKKFMATIAPDFFRENKFTATIEMDFFTRKKIIRGRKFGKGQAPSPIVDKTALRFEIRRMAVTPSTMELALGAQAPDFRLPDTYGKMVRLADFKNASALLVMFICNHCPYVKHLRAEFARLAKDYQPRGVAIVAISSNDAEKYPADSPEKMKEEKQAAGYTFPYLFDGTQEVAKIYRAACTPDFFLFDKQQKTFLSRTI